MHTTNDWVASMMVVILCACQQAIGSASVLPDIARPGQDALSIRNIRLEPAPPIDRFPSARVKFELHNDGSDSLTDIMLRLSLIERSRNHPNTQPTIVAGPVTIRSKAVLSPGYSLAFEITLRNVSADCRCVPTIDVVDARRAP
jgi:hypothetical protein